MTGMKQICRVWLLGYMLFIPSQVVSVDFCSIMFQKLVRGSSDLAGKTLKLATLPAVQKKEAIQKLSQSEKIALAHAALRAGLTGKGLESGSIPDDLLFKIHPSARDIPGRPSISSQLKKGFQKDAARSVLTAYKESSGEFRPGIWFDLIQSATLDAPPKERREIAKTLLSHLKDLPMDWGPQTRFDQFIDEALGLNAEKVTQSLNQLSGEELKIRFGEELVWSGFGNRYLLTPYFEFQNIIQKLNPKSGQLWVDLGSGLGRQGIYLGVTHPDVRFQGYEIVEERVAESERARKALELDQVKFSRQDLSDPKFKPEAADFYYAFNPVSGATFLKMMNDLREQAVKHNKPFTLVLAFSKDVNRVLEENTGFQEKVFEPRFEGDDFARFFYFDPERPWTAFPETKIKEQKEKDRQLGVVGATANQSTPPLTGEPRAIEFSDQREVEQALAKSGKFHSNLDFVALWSWNPEDRYSISKQDGALLLSGNHGTEKFFIEPLGLPHEESAKVVSGRLKSKNASQFKYVSLETAKILENDPELRVELDTDLLDFIYESKKLALLSTPKSKEENQTLSKDFRYKRNKALEFASSNPRPRFEKVDSLASKEQVFDFLKTWAETNKQRIGNSGRVEVEASMRMLEKMDQLGLECHVLRQGENVVGFSLGKVTEPGVFTVFAEKALTHESYAGAYPLLTGLQAESLIPRRIFKINRMDDGGEGNLRKAKMALDPLEQPPVFRVTRREP